MRMVASSAKEHLNNDVLHHYGLFLEIKYYTGTCKLNSRKRALYAWSKTFLYLKFREILLFTV